MFTVVWDELHDDRAATEHEQTFARLGEARAHAEGLQSDETVQAIIVWDEARGEEIPWPW